VFLSTLRDNPDPKEDALFVSMGIINTRSRLAPPYNERGRYPAQCVAVSAIAVPVAKVDMSSTRTQLLSTTAMVKGEYTVQKTYPALLGQVAQFADAMVGALTSQPCVYL
jgi:hypothetical protein